MATFVNTYVTGIATVNDLTITGALDIPSITLTDTTDQIDMGAATFNTIISAPAKAATSTYSIPDVGVTSDFAMTAGNQTFTGVKTLTTPRILDSDLTNSYIVGVSNLAADRTVTLPLLLGNDTFTFDSFATTLSNKTLASPVTTGQVTSAAGTSGAPTYSFTGTATHGMYLIGSGINAELALSVGTQMLGVTNGTVRAFGVMRSANEINDIATFTTTPIDLASAGAKRIVIMNVTGAPSTITLPTGAANTGVIFTIIRMTAGVDVNNVTIARGGSDTIDDGVATSLVLTSQYQRVTLRYINSLALWLIV
jgi:hypothetical protein